MHAGDTAPITTGGHMCRETEQAFVAADALIPTASFGDIVEAAQMRHMSPAEFVGMAAALLAHDTLSEVVEERDDEEVVLDYSHYDVLMAADEVQFDEDGTPLCTDIEMSARFGQDWRDIADADVSDDDIERHLARADARRRAAVRAADPYAWHDKNGKSLR